MNSWWLDNVIVEREIVDTADLGPRTRTETWALKITDGVIEQAYTDGIPTAATEPAPVVDAAGALLLPPWRDMHMHLDKTNCGVPWQAPIPGRTWPAEELRILPELSAAIPERSNLALDVLVSKGTGMVVAHCNVDHIVGTANVERLLDVLRGRDDIDWEVVAYPQHGLRDGAIPPLLERSLELGATVLGAQDPALYEGDITRALDTTFGLAVDHGVDIDFHLHDGGSLGMFETDQVIRSIERHDWQGRVRLSTASAVHHCSPDALPRVAARLAAAGVRLGTTVGVGGTVFPADRLDEAGVEVSLGNDRITDMLSPYGQGSIGEQVWLLAQRLGRNDERSIAETLVFGAGPDARWQPDGTREWPQVGAPASFLLVPATCSAEAIARRIGPTAVYHRGREVFRAA